MTHRVPGRCFFVNLINGRCGSTLLTNYLNQVPDIINYPEVLVGAAPGEKMNLMEAMVAGRRIEEINPHAASDVVFSKPVIMKEMSRLSAVGLKTKYGDVGDLRVFMDFIEANGFRILFMHRENVVKTVLSRVRATAFFNMYGDYNVVDPREQHVDPVQIDINEFEQMLEFEERFNHDRNHIVGTTSCPVLGVTYESLIEDTAGTIDRVLRFLDSEYRLEPAGPTSAEIGVVRRNDGVSVSTLVTKVFKMTSDEMRDAIANYDEFREYFSRTKFAHFLD